MSLKDDREYRSLQDVEIQPEGETGVRVRGYAAVFEQETTIGDYFIERIARGAFTETLKRRGIKGAVEDVVFLINHNDSLLLARTRSGTLTLGEDDKGLWIESVLDDIDPDAVRVVRKMRRGDMDKMSFAMRATRQQWEDIPDALPRRTIMEAELFDVSVVTDPAYSGTDIGLRSAKQVIDARTAEINPAQAAARRLRMKHELFVRRSA